MPKFAILDWQTRSVKLNHSNTLETMFYAEVLQTQTLYCLGFQWFANLFQYLTFQTKTKTNQTVFVFSWSKLKQIKLIQYFMIKTKTNQIDFVFHDQN